MLKIALAPNKKRYFINCAHVSQFSCEFLSNLLTIIMIKHTELYYRQEIWITYSALVSLDLMMDLCLFLMTLTTFLWQIKLRKTQTPCNSYNNTDCNPPMMT